MTQTFLAAVGDANDPSAFGGTPFHLLQEGMCQGFLTEGLPLGADSLLWKSRRYFWNLLSVLRGRGLGGYQFSDIFMEKLWGPYRSKLVGNKVINLNQLYPSTICQDRAVEKWFFIDQTLKQLFDTYGIRSGISKYIAEDALAREADGYQRAKGVFVISHFAAQSLYLDYGVSPDKVFVVPRGANLDREAYPLWAQTKSNSKLKERYPLRLVFVGKHPERKGLDRLLRALALARAEGANCTLRIIGCTPDDLAPELRDTQGVEWIGFIDKRRDGVTYLNAVGECDIGCLLSRAEAGGIGLREYHALGLAVIGPDVGGSPDHVIPEAARLIGPQASDEEIAALLLELDRDRAAVQRMQEVSWARRHEVTWEASVTKLAKVMGKTS